MPACAKDGLRYALIENGLGYYYSVYLRVQAPQQCLQAFVDDNSMVGTLQNTKIGPAEEEHVLHVRSTWQDSDIVRRMGWQVGPEQRFQKFAVGKPTQYSVTMLIQHSVKSGDLIAYVHAVHGG